MKIRWFVVFLMVLFLSSCSIVPQKELPSTEEKNATDQNESTFEKSGETHHQEITETKIDASSLSFEKGETVDLPEVGLRGCLVTEKAAIRNASLEENPLYVYVLSDFRYGEDARRDSYLVAETGNQVLIFDLKNGSYDDTLYLGDLDGDSSDEIILHQMVGATGGAGQFISRILKCSENEWCEMFRSQSDEPGGGVTAFDTGYYSEFLEGKKLKIANSITGYSTIIDLSEKYTEDFFDETGKGRLNVSIGCDPFFEFYPKNVDGDAAFEIECVQYVFLSGHADGIGYAKSVLKYNEQTKRFEVIQSTFSTQEND